MSVNWLTKTLVTTATIALGAVVYLLLIWVLIQIGLPASWTWLPVVLGPLVVGGVYIAVLFTSLGKYLFNLPPGSLG